MLKRITKTKHKSRQAFTLVELIVVLVILAVLAAAITPALIGYIKKAKLARVYGEAEDFRVAIQAVAIEYYGKNDSYLSGTLDSAEKNGNVHWDAEFDSSTDEDREWGNKILQLVGRNRSNEPYILVFGVAKTDEQGLNPYEVVYVGYLPDQNSPAVFYINGEWSNKYPRDSGAMSKGKVDGKNVNYIVRNKKKIPVQLFVVSNGTGTENEIWITDAGGENTLQGHSAGHYGY